MSGYLPDGCSERDFDLAMLGFSCSADEELWGWEIEEPPEQDPEDPGPLFEQEERRMWVMLGFETTRVFAPDVAPVLDLYLHGKITAAEWAETLGWPVDVWDRNLAGVFAQVLGQGPGLAVHMDPPQSMGASGAN